MDASVAKATLNLCRGLGLLSLALAVALSLSLYPIKIPIVLKFAKRERHHPSTRLPVHSVLSLPSVGEGSRKQVASFAI